MPDPDNTGVKHPAGSPPAGTGAGAGQQPPATAGSPPEDDLEFVDDQVVEQDGKKMVPLEAFLGEREKWKKRVAQTPPAPPPPEEPAEEPEPDQPLFNWDKLVPQQSGAGQHAQPLGAQGPPVDPQQFEEQFRDMLNEKPWQAMQWAIQTGMQYRDRLEGQARQFVPDYGNLPVHEVSDQEIQMLASNPYAMRAMIAKSKAAAGGGRRQSTSPNPPQNPPAAPPAVSQEAIRQAVELIRSMGGATGVTGEGTGGPAAPPASGESYELDKDAVSYLRNRGYTDEQIREQAKRIVDIRRKRGQAV